MTTSESKGRFFYYTNGFESIRIMNRIDSNRELECSSRKSVWPVKKLEWCGAGMVMCLEWGADLHIVQLMPLSLTVSCFCKIQIGFTFLGSATKRAVKRGCVCICVCAFAILTDLLRIEKTSGGVVRERMKCDINRVLIGNVSIFDRLTYIVAVSWVSFMVGFWLIT